MKTLKQAIKIFEEWANNHPEINDFIFDNINNVTLKDRAINYPMLWVAPQPMTLTKLNFDIYFAELLSLDRRNLLDGMSDMNNIVYDFVRYFESKYKVSNARITPFEGKFDDYTVGVILNIEFDYWNINSCEDE